MVPCFKIEKLSVTLSPSPNSLAFVNGIKVVSTPKNMYIEHQDKSISFVNSKIPFSILDATTFGNCLLSNVGRPTVANADETPTYTTPVVVYTTSRTMGLEPNINMNYNLTWNFYIDGGFNYLLRLHFYETQLQSSGNGIPVYRDYVLLIPSEGSSNQTLCLALHLSEKVGSKFADAILNNLEIFRLKKSDGSLAMPNPKSISSLASLNPENKQPKKGKNLSMKIFIGVSIGCTITLRYVNLVSLIAIAMNNEKIIVYEFMTNGTLPRGLGYLHSGAAHRVIHQDIKSTNILLDEEYVVKISDFGLFKMSPSSMTNDPIRTMISLANWARKCIGNESIDESIDPFLKSKISLNCLRTYAKIAENCIRENGCQRPSMYVVARKLEFALQLQEIGDSEQIGQVSDGAQSQVNQDHYLY
ncbi:hypothetical protein Gohar_014991 [Gossypium harknessii]|uniref:Protein kinase domain-containing protein n=1 Tax=Gossypium harknessii TaxID=34285 RepID=A0A7J9FYA0_9ROSI|nr:hypothetical protein [Gossypium harknessii]